MTTESLQKKKSVFKVNNNMVCLVGNMVYHITNFKISITISPSAPVLSTLSNSSWIPIGEWASLSCTAPCTDAVVWYTKNNPHPIRYSLPGLKIRKTVLQQSDCSSRKDNYTEMLEVFATAQSNATELQCVSIPVCTNTDVQCRPQVCYVSRPVMSR